MKLTPAGRRQSRIHREKIRRLKLLGRYQDDKTAPVGYRHHNGSFEMKRVFFFGVIAYSAAIFLLNDLPAAVGFTGVAALPWMAKCLVDLCFAGAAFFTMFGSQIDWDDEEEGIHADDVKVPATWLYGLFGVNLLLNFGWHGYQFATLNGAESLYNGAWWFAEFIAMGLTFVFFSHARKIAQREARKARDSAKKAGSTPLSRSAVA